MQYSGPAKHTRARHSFFFALPKKGLEKALANLAVNAAVPRVRGKESDLSAPAFREQSGVPMESNTGAPLRARRTSSRERSRYHRQPTRLRELGFFKVSEAISRPIRISTPFWWTFATTSRAWIVTSVWLARSRARGFTDQPRNATTPIRRATNGTLRNSRCKRRLACAIGVLRHDGNASRWEMPQPYAGPRPSWIAAVRRGSFLSRRETALGTLYGQHYLSRMCGGSRGANFSCLRISAGTTV